ncbi:MAG: hypothetical protein SVR94_11085 [Pseudomonadota bacterium]|nr:hypothetical protein [Pseudomonadota bacterium]
MKRSMVVVLSVGLLVVLVIPPVMPTPPNLPPAEPKDEDTVAVTI